jgi:Mor family transcriptional regulator
MGTRLIFFTFLIALTINSRSFGAEHLNPTLFFSGFIHLADSIVKSKLNSYSSSEKSDSSFDALLVQNPFIFGFSIANDKGDLEYETNKGVKPFYRKKSFLKENWFSIPFSEKKTFDGGIVRASNRTCILRSYPLFDKHTTSTSGVCAVLIDFEYCCEKLKENYNEPFSLYFRKTLVYANNCIQGPILSSASAVSGCDGLEFNNCKPDTLPDNVQSSLAEINSQHKTSIINPLLWTFSIIVLISAFYLGLNIKSRKTLKEKLIQQEYNKLSDEKRKQIYNLARSQIYCEIKRQIETHESTRIEAEIRKKIETEVEIKNRLAT